MDKMKSSAKNIKLKKYDDIFNIDDVQKSNIEELPLDLLIDFKNHPFKVEENKEMTELAESIKEHGILVPAIVRKQGDKYEIISGHRRKYCAAILGLQKIPVVVKEIDDDEAVLIMIDSNVQREHILPSEKAFSYKMKMEAMKRQGERADLTSRQLVAKLESTADTIGKDNKDSGRQVQRYMRLTELTPFFLNAVDRKELALNTGVDISYLAEGEQKLLEEFIHESGRFPSLAQAKKIKELTGHLTKEMIKEIVCKKPKDTYKIYISASKVRSLFPEEYTEKEVEEAILEILEKWKGE